MVFLKTEMLPSSISSLLGTSYSSLFSSSWSSLGTSWNTILVQVLSIRFFIAYFVVDWKLSRVSTIHYSWIYNKWKNSYILSQVWKYFLIVTTFLSWFCQTWIFFFFFFIFKKIIILSHGNFILLVTLKNWKLFWNATQLTQLTNFQTDF